MPSAQKTTFTVPQIDCPSEENLIREWRGPVSTFEVGPETSGVMPLRGR